MKILSIQIGPTVEVPPTGTEAWWDKPWETGFYKAAASGPQWLGYLGLRGDDQADRKNHGGVDKAVCVYPGEHYETWRTQPDLAAMSGGAFGENFTTAGLREADVCVGDIFTVGGARVQVSQPREPCWKLSRRWRVKDLTAQVERTGRTGFYFRVLSHGPVEAGDPFTLVARPFPELTVAWCNEVMHHRKGDAAAARTLAECPALAASWKDGLWLRAEALDRTAT